MTGKPAEYLIYTENFAHCFICRSFLLSRFLAFLGGMASWIELDPQRVVIAEFDIPLEQDPVAAARYFAAHGYYRGPN
jgi:hypothetical protein